VVRVALALLVLVAALSISPAATATARDSSASRAATASVLVELHEPPVAAVGGLRGSGAPDLRAPQARRQLGAITPEQARVEDTHGTLQQRAMRLRICRPPA
jgi:hypothetical protein